MFFNTKSDFVAIGETTIDAFIRLEGNGIHTQGEGQNSILCLPFATKIPYSSAEEIPAVGNAGNASVSASRLGLKSALVANVGSDDNGKKCINSLKKDGVKTEFIGIDKTRQTNYHYVLWFGEDRTILQKHSQFDYKLPDIGEPKWIYLTSLGENSLEFHKIIAAYLKKHPKINLAFQPGIFQIKFGVENLKEIYSLTNIVCCNVEEAQTILSESSRDLKILLQKMAQLGPKIVLITDGMEGAYAYDSKENKFWFMPVYPHVPYERTGAGDAFFSTVVSALSLGKNLSEALMWGPINSKSVVEQVGAQKGLLPRQKLLEFLSKAPADYTPREI